MANKYYTDSTKTALCMKVNVSVFVPTHLTDWLMGAANVSRRRANQMVVDDYIHLGADLGIQSGESHLVWNATEYLAQEYADTHDPDYIARIEADGSLVYRNEEGEPATDFGIRWTVK